MHDQSNDMTAASLRCCTSGIEHQYLTDHTIFNAYSFGVFLLISFLCHRSLRHMDEHCCQNGCLLANFPNCPQLDKVWSDSRNSGEKLPLSNSVHSFVNSLTYNLERMQLHPRPQFLFTRASPKDGIKDFQKLAVIGFVKLISIARIVSIVVVEDLKNKVKWTQSPALEYIKGFHNSLCTQHP